MDNACEECGKVLRTKEYVMTDGVPIEKIRKICYSCRAEKDPNRKYETENRLLKDGIYDVTNIEILYFNDINWDEPKVLEAQEGVKELMDSNPDYVVAHPYGAYTIYVLSSRPEKIEVHVAGSNFNYGSSNLLKNCPSDILILAEDD